MALRKKTRRKITYITIFIILCICVKLFLSNLDNLDFEIDMNTGTNYREDNIIINNGNDLVLNYCDISIGLVDIDTFNPILTKNSDVIKFSQLVYNSLFDYSKNMDLVTELVDTYNYNDNDLYIKLKKDIYWHDGNRLNADDVTFTINMIKEHKGIYYDFVKNINTVEVIDDYTIKLTVFDKSILTEYDLVFPIISSKYYEGEDFKKTDKNMQPMGTGMYKFVENTDKQFLFTYNSKSKEKTQVANITVIDYSSISEAYAGIKNKKVDMIFTSLTNYDEFIGKIGYSKEEYIDNTYMFLAVNIANKYLNNLEVRKAINIGLDKQSIFNDIYNGLGYVSQSLIYPHSYLYKNIDVNYDIDRAKQILIDNNLTNQVNLNLLVDSSNEKNVLVANNIMEQLQKINVKINVVKKNSKEYIEGLEKGNYDLALVNFNISNNINMKMFEDNAYYSVFNFENVTFKNYISNIKNMDTYIDRKQNFINIQAMILEELPYIGIGFMKETVIFSSDLLGVTDLRYNNLFINFSEFYKK